MIVSHVKALELTHAEANVHDSERYLCSNEGSLVTFSFLEVAASVGAQPLGEQLILLVRRQPRRAVTQQRGAVLTFPLHGRYCERASLEEMLEIKGPRWLPSHHSAHRRGSSTGSWSGWSRIVRMPDWRTWHFRAPLI